MVNPTEFLSKLEGSSLEDVLQYKVREQLETEQALRIAREEARSQRLAGVARDVDALVRSTFSVKLLADLNYTLKPTYTPGGNIKVEYLFRYRQGVIAMTVQVQEYTQGRPEEYKYFFGAEGKSFTVDTIGEALGEVLDYLVDIETNHIRGEYRN